MYQITDLYPATKCNTEAMAEMAIGAPVRPNAFLKHCHKSFVLIGDIVVPNAFLDELANHVMPWNMVFDEDDVITAREMVGELFWSGLNANKRRVLGACILILIEQGRVVLEVPTAKRKAA
jgi:hypothetical protein